MAARGLQIVPESLRPFFREKPHCDFKDVMNTEYQVWINYCLHRGYVMIKSEKKGLLYKKKWNRYYVIISSNLVLLFKNCQERNGKPQEYFSLSHPNDTIDLAADKATDKNKFVLEIKTGHKDDKDWVFGWQDHHEMEVWNASFQATTDFFHHRKILRSCMDILMVDKGLKAGTIKGGDGNLVSPYQVAVEGDVFGDGNDYVFTERPMTHAYDYPAMLTEHVYDAPPPGTLKWTDITDKELSILAGKFGSDWKAFARETLLLQQTEIQHIENNNRNDLKEQIFSAFVAWRRKQEELKIKAKLIELLKNSGYCDHDAWEFLQTTSASGYRGRKESSDYEEPSTSTYYNVSRSDGPTISKMESNRIYCRHMYDGTTLANPGIAETSTTSRATQLFEPKSNQVQEKTSTSATQGCHNSNNENMRMSVAAIKQKWENHNSLK